MYRKSLVDRIEQVDRDHIAAYNLRRNEKYQLQVQMGPCPYEGDLERAKVVLLLANPGFDKDSHVDDHKFHRSGWALSGLHDEAPDGMRLWWRARLARLIQEFDAQHIANNVAAIQLCAWASNKFDGALRLPSRQLQLELAEAVIARGALILITRSAKYWEESSIIRNYARQHRARSYLNSRVTEGNYPSGWHEIRAALST